MFLFLCIFFVELFLIAAAFREAHQLADPALLFIQAFAAPRTGFHGGFIPGHKVTGGIVFAAVVGAALLASADQDLTAAFLAGDAGFLQIRLGVSALRKAGAGIEFAELSDLQHHVPSAFVADFIGFLVPDDNFLHLLFGLLQLRLKGTVKLPEHFLPVSFAFRKDTDEVFVILGGGPAAKSAAEAIRTRNHTATVTIITQEAHLPYNRPMLTKGIVRDFGYNGLVMEGPEWYENNDVNFVPETVALRVDTAARKVFLRYSDGSDGQLGYDKLIYALGAYCFVPPIKGSDLDHVVSVRSISDTDRVKQIIADRNATKAVCIGGGVMGLEGAWGLKEGGLEVTVLETAPGLLPRQLDDTASEMLQQLCIEAGVNVVTGVKIAEITENAVVLDDGTEFEAQLVIMSTGMRPYTKVAEDSGIAVDKWVTADSYMRTDKPGIYTAGDCCSVNGQPQAFWAQAVETGRIAGANAAGDQIEYKPIGSSLVIEAMNTSVFALGTNGKDPDRKFRSEQVIDEVKKTYSKYYYYHGKLVGTILIGDISGMSAAIRKMK